MEFADRYGPMAVIAGGSEGVGAAYAMELAERGLDLALIARNPGPLDATADQVRKAFPERSVLTLTVDLSAPDAADRVVALTAGNEVGLLIYNAGASSRSGNFLDGDLEFPQSLLAVNAATMMALVHAYGRPMKARGRGGIVVMSSMAYLVGNPGLAAYSGSKAFSTLFCEALWHELRPHGVHVLSHVLGMTDTPANARNYPGMGGMGDKPEDIVQQALAALDKGPVLRATGGDETAQYLGSLSRDAAVATMYEMGAAFRD
ncbi:MAG: SDR family NAD(P)-dependent oxidoreductase [Novosphingobium sp.]|nr:SDR family NAD(P)-dependent oxidoreductase [Novosphingobium sp.]